MAAFSLHSRDIRHLQREARPRLYSTLAIPLDSLASNPHSKSAVLGSFPSQIDRQNASSIL